MKFWDFRSVTRIVECRKVAPSDLLLPATTVGHAATYGVSDVRDVPVATVESDI